VPENETILYRGASFELGHGSGFYGIWPSGSPRPPSIEWWPDTPDGWQGAWARYNALEVPGSITMVSPQQQQPRQAAGHLGTRALLAAGLLAAGIICGLAGLFPSYLAGSSLTSQASQVIPHVFYLAGWIASLVLILLGGARLRVGVLLSLGLSVVTFGFFFSDAGEVIADGSHIMGAGLALSLIGWLACAAGSVVALPLGAGSFRRSVAQLRSAFAPAPATAAPQATPAPAAQFPPATEVQPTEAAPSPSDAPEAPEVPSAAASAAETESAEETAVPAAPTEAPPPGGLWTSPVPATPPYAPNTAYGAYQPARSSRWSNPVGRRAILAVSLAVLSAIGAAITFAPSWDSYTLRTAAGTVHTLTAGNAFSNPAAVIVGDVAVMVALVLVAAIAALWRPARLGAVLLAGALIPMVAQAISALAQLGEAVSPAQFGISSAEASQLGLTISQGVTAVFWIYCVFVVALAVICGWLFAKPRRTRQAVAPAAVGTYT
jgi:MFS family permease